MNNRMEGSSLKITTLLKKGILIVRLEGEIDVHVADDFRKVLDDELIKNQVKNILLNLADVTFIDSSGLGVILGRYKKINVLGGKIFVSNIQPQVQRIFELSGLLRIMKLFDSEKEALDYL